jgi:hypothetical protein
MDLKGLTLCSQKPTIGSIPEPVESSLHFHNLFPVRSILILFSNLCLDLPNEPKQLEQFPLTWS